MIFWWLVVLANGYKSHFMLSNSMGKQLLCSPTPVQIDLQEFDHYVCRTLLLEATPPMF